MAEIWWRMNWEQRDLSWSLNFVTGIAVFLAQDLLGREYGFLARSLVLLDADFRSYTVAFRAISPTKFWGLLSLLADRPMWFHICNVFAFHDISLL